MKDWLQHKVAGCSGTLWDIEAHGGWVLTLQDCYYCGLVEIIEITSLTS